ncbi:MAG: hypothetical protein WC307_06365 [Candidatus Nanoarchaeia archaeon]|jgi:hypothetical protein
MRAETASHLTILLNSEKSFAWFVRYIFPLSYSSKEFKEAHHTWIWADLIQNNKLLLLESARKHLKSTILYAFIMWRLLHLDADLEILYLSYKQELAQYHLKNVKELIKRNPYFENIKDLTQAEGILKYEVNGFKLVVEPEGILSFKRGRHPHGIINDDILADPSNQLDLTVIQKITRIFKEDVMSLPKEGGFNLVFGTPQHEEDLFSELKKMPGWNYSENKAILDEANKVVLWPELFNYERLCQIRDDEIGEKAFSKEYMCSPIYSEEAFFTRKVIQELVNPDLSNSLILSNISYLTVVAGIDIGKHAHPSHFCVFVKNLSGKFIQLFSKFMDGVEYIEQVKFCNEVINALGVNQCFFDNSRGEFEGFMEQGIIDKSIWIPVKFSTTVKGQMASNFEKIVKDKRIEFINDERMIKSILSVNNDLNALETDIGHGDAFWSVAMSLMCELKKASAFSFL